MRRGIEIPTGLGPGIKTSRETTSTHCTIPDPDSQTDRPTLTAACRDLLIDRFMVVADSPGWHRYAFREVIIPTTSHKHSLGELNEGVQS